MKLDPEVLEGIREEFEQMINEGEVQAYSFVEEYPTAGVGLVSVLHTHLFQNINKLRACDNRWLREIRHIVEIYPRARVIYSVGHEPAMLEPARA